MPVRRRVDKHRAELLPEAVDWLNGGEGGTWSYFEQDLGEVWREYADAIVGEHVAQFPGTRPLRWWQYSAPEPRRRLGGVGTPKSEVLADAPSLYLGLPRAWVSRAEADYYNGRAIDVHGQPIRDGYREGQFRGVPIDPADSPLYESEAAYLDRHGLLLPGERRRLKPADFEPQTVLEIFDLEAERAEMTIKTASLRRRREAASS